LVSVSVFFADTAEIPALLNQWIWCLYLQLQRNSWMIRKIF